MGKQEHLVEHKSKHGCPAVSKVQDEYWEKSALSKKVSILDILVNRLETLKSIHGLQRPFVDA